jgi:hypothetical protein
MSKRNKRLTKIVASVTAATSAFAMLMPGVGAAAAVFKDVPATEYYAEAVNHLQASGMIQGNTDGTYRPNERVTRAQAAKIIALALGLDTTSMQDPGFKDVPKDHFAYPYISALAKEGIIEGYDHQFKPNDGLTRAQMAKMIALAYDLRLYDLRQLPFADVKSGDWFANFVGALVDSGITTGTTPTTYSPNEFVTRGQIAALVYRSETKAETAEAQATIADITDEALVTSEGTYALSAEQKKWLNPSNLAALQGAAIAFTAKGNALDTIQRIDLTANGAASADSSDPYANHVAFDGKGATVAADLAVNGDYLTVKNMTIQGNLHVGQGVENSFYSEFTKVEGKTTIDDALQAQNRTVRAKNSVRIAANEETRGRVVFSEFQLGNVDIDKKADVIFLSKTTGTSTIGEVVVSSDATIASDSSVTIPKVTVASGAKDVTINSNVSSLEVTSNTTQVTLGTGAKIVNLVLPTGSKPSDVIGNYETVKQNIEQVGGTKNPDATPAPSSDTGGGTVTPTTPTAPAAPTGVHGIALSLNLANDGKIAGLDATKTYQYKLATAETWTNVPAASTEITGLAPGDYEVRIAANGNVPASPAAAATVADSQLVEAVTLDGKDGVSSQDGKFETIRLKFTANVDESTVTTNSFSIPGFTVESIKVTDKNGRTAPDPLYTQGEQKYITIRVTPADGTHHAPTVTQHQNSVIELAGDDEVKGVHVQAKDQAAPVIIESEFLDKDADGADEGDQVVIRFSEPVALPEGIALAEVRDDFTLQKIDGSLVTPYAFHSDDQFEIAGNTVTVTLGATTEPATGAKITISDAGVSLTDEAGNKAKPQKEFVDPTRYSEPKAVDIENIPAYHVPAVLLEVVTLDGKDGVSSQDGQFETIRLKFAANLNGNTINTLNKDFFTVPGFIVESAKVTDKNGRTPDSLLYTHGEEKYITIRVAPVAGTHFTPTVVQQPNTSIVDVNGVQIAGIFVRAKDQAAPVIIDSEYIDNDNHVSDQGDQIVIQFSENVELPNGVALSELADDFKRSNGAFQSDDQFVVSGNTVTVTLGATTHILSGTTITINDTGVSLVDRAGNKAKPQKEFKTFDQYSDPKVVDIKNIPASN